MAQGGGMILVIHLLDISVAHPMCTHSSNAREQSIPQCGNATFHFTGISNTRIYHMSDFLNIHDYCKVYI